MSISVFRKYVLFLCTVACFGEEQPTGNSTDKRHDAMFTEKGYPSYGDIPVLNRKIFRGIRVTIAEHPYVVNIRRNYGHYLTGTILSTHVILSAGYPIYKVPIQELTVVVGEHYSDRGAAVYTVMVVVMHQNFNEYTLNADISLIRLYENLLLKSTVKPIRLIQNVLNGTRVFVTGWGRCDWTGKELCLPRSFKHYPYEKHDPMLRTVSFMNQVNNPYCGGYRQHGIEILPGMLCVGIAREEFVLAPCIAVPGAPLVTGGRLAGLLSWGFGCGFSHDLPLIYTDVNYYRIWITKNLEILNNINKDDLLELYLATQSYKLRDWLMRTRLNTSQLKIPQFKLQLSAIDSILESLQGSVYDIRDYAFNGSYHRDKQEAYTDQRLKLIREAKLKEKTLLRLKQLGTVQPFLNKTVLVKEKFDPEFIKAISNFTIGRRGENNTENADNKKSIAV